MVTGSPDPAVVAERLAWVRERIDAAGGAGRVAIVAVTKGFPPVTAAAALDAGLADLGENYAQDLVAKASMLSLRPAPPRWHFLGPLQTNKAARLGPWVRRWHGVDREAAGRAIARHQSDPEVFVEVNVHATPGRPGCRPEVAPNLVETFRGLGLSVVGLMTVAPAGDPAMARATFRRLAEMAEDLGLAELSMGMSDDFEIAVEEGATTVRLGRALFGPRPGRNGAER
jgi:uncharacterized pyridoxal phosphate-containing UPF0001 family protein